MIETIQEHLARYPKMQIRDVAKLIYQNEFGGGHMIANSEMSLKRIQEEYNTLDSTIKHQPVILESIGNSISRIYLSALSSGLRAETLNELFVQSANNTKGCIDEFERKLNLFLDACDSGTFPFPQEEVRCFIREWKENGYPAISHSDIYREAYQPAYRVIDDSYANVIKVIEKVTMHLQDLDANLPYIIMIDGMSGSGKSALGNLLQKNFPESSLFHMDDYFLQPHQRTVERLTEIGGNVDYERFKKEILEHLNDKNGLTYQKYDCCTQQLENKIHVPWQPLVIIEGSYSHHPHFKEFSALHIFCEIDEEEQKKRILKRNGAQMLERFVTEWIPKENCYFKKFHIKENADILF